MARATETTRSSDDPHPPNEEHPYRHRTPAGAGTPRDSTERVNDTTHDGKPKPRPRNAETS